MELHKLKKDEISTYSAERLQEAEHEIRKELAKLRFQVLKKKNEGQSHIGKGLRRNLARVLTFKHALVLNSAQQQVSE